MAGGGLSERPRGGRAGRNRRDEAQVMNWVAAQNPASLLFEQGLQGVDCSGASAPPIKPFPYSPYLKGKNPMKSILVTGLLFCLAISTIHALSQDRGRGEKGASSSTSDQIDVKTDRFS